LAPACVVQLESEPPGFEIHLPADWLGDTVTVELRREGGAVESLAFPVDELRQTAAMEIDGRSFIARRVPLPGSLPAGYHEIRTRCRDAEAVTRYIVAPQRAYAHPHLSGGARAAGVSIALYGVRSARNW